MNVSDYASLCNDPEIYNFDFDSLNDRYSLPEYLDLRDKLESIPHLYASFNRALNAYTQEIIYGTPPLSTKTIKVTNISLWIYQHDRTLFKMLYVMDFDLMPLELFKNDTNSVVAAWRLEIGK